MFLKILLIPLIVISTKAYSQKPCKKIFTSAEEVIIEELRKWGESSLKRNINKDELLLLEIFYTSTESSHLKRQFLQNREEFSDKEVEILSQREVKSRTVNVQVPKNTQEEGALKEQGFNAAYRRGMNEVNEWIAIREQLIKSQARPYQTHVDYFANKMWETVEHIEAGVTNSSQKRKIERLKRRGRMLIENKKVTYYNFLRFSLLLTSVLERSPMNQWTPGIRYANVHKWIRRITPYFPFYIGMPTTTGEMGIIAINKSVTHGVSPLGLKREDLGSRLFFLHDLSHFPDLGLRLKYHSEPSAKLFYSKLIEHTKDFPLEKRKNIELAYFVLTHEGNYQLDLLNPGETLPQIRHIITSVVTLKNSEMKGLIDLSHDPNKKVQAVIEDFLEVYQLIQRELETEAGRETATSLQI